MSRIASRILHRILSTRLIANFPGILRLRIRSYLYRHSADFEPECKYLARLGPNEGAALDVGANFGIYTLQLAGLYERVYAFEPHPLVFRELKEANLRNVFAVQAAVSQHPGTLTLRVPIKNGRPLYGWSSVENADLPGETQESVQVDALRIDDMQLPRIGFIKIDVEGHEMDVLLGAQKTIARDHPVILCETKGENESKVTTLLRSMQYRRSNLKDLCNVEGATDNWIYLRDG